MSFKRRYPDFASVEHHIHQAHAERAVVIATVFADAIFALLRGLRRVGGSVAAPVVTRRRNGALAAKTAVAQVASST